MVGLSPRMFHRILTGTFLVLLFLDGSFCGLTEEYLVKYGYLSDDTDMSSSAALQAIEPAMMRLQGMYGIPRTGILDDATREMMQKPRCGVQDTVPNTRRGKRYAHVGTKWTKQALTYRIEKYTRDLSRSEVDRTVDNAFKEWGKYIPLTFEARAQGAVDISIVFDEYNHGDGYEFDGAGGTLAHAFYPPREGSADDMGGDTHFDESELWTINSATGTDLYYTAVHEFGHALGLLHSKQPASLMWPWSNPGLRGDKVKLNSDDIQGIQALYPSEDAGTDDTPETTTSSTPEARPTPANPRRVCDRNVDAVTIGVDGGAYFFLQREVFKIGRDNYVVAGFPKPIEDVFPGAPKENVNAALTYQGPWDEKKTYLFKGSRYWRFSEANRADGSEYTLDEGYPKDVASGWGFEERDFDAVFTKKGSNGVYFIKGDQYWKHSGSSYGLYPGYPRDLTSHPVLQSFAGVDAAFEYVNGKDYFFYKNQYYRHGEGQGMVGPRRTGEWWFGCISERLRQSGIGSIKRKKTKKSSLG